MVSGSDSVSIKVSKASRAQIDQQLVILCTGNLGEKIAWERGDLPKTVMIYENGEKRNLKEKKYQLVP